MIINICLVIMFFCFAFIVLNRRIQLFWFAKGLMCIGMLSIVGMLAIPKHHDTIMEVFFIVMSFLVSYGTLFVYRIGVYK